jgi:hypothetical protein
VFRRVQGAVQVQQRRALRGFLAVQRVQDGAGRATAVAQFLQNPSRRSALSEDLAGRRRRCLLQAFGVDLVVVDAVDRPYVLGCPVSLKLKQCSALTWDASG